MFYWYGCTWCWICGFPLARCLLLLWCLVGGFGLLALDFGVLSVLCCTLVLGLGVGLFVCWVTGSCPLFCCFG